MPLTNDLSNLASKANAVFNSITANNTSITSINVAGQSIGGGSFWETDATITADYTITAGKNAGTFGPVTVANGVTVTVPSGSVWTVV